MGRLSPSTWSVALVGMAVFVFGYATRQACRLGGVAQNRKIAKQQLLKWGSSWKRH